MRQLTTKLTVGAALVIWLMIVSMWVRSYWVADYFFFDPDGEYAAQVVTTRGVLHVHFRGGWLLPSSGAELPDYPSSGGWRGISGSGWDSGTIICFPPVFRVGKGGNFYFGSYV